MSNYKSVGENLTYEERIYFIARLAKCHILDTKIELIGEGNDERTRPSEVSTLRRGEG